MSSPLQAHTPRSSASSPGPSSSPSTLNDRTSSPSSRTANSQAINLGGGSYGNSPSDDNGREGENLQRRHRPRNSGGFLLGSTSLASNEGRSQNIISGAETGRNRSGKDRDLGGVSFKIRGKQDSRDAKRNTIGKSPLVNEITQQGKDGEGAADEDPRADGEPGASGQRSSTESGDFVSQNFDADPAQIVSLALNLSENRRRHFSNGRISLADPTAGRRLVSTPQIGSTLPTPGVGSLRHHLNQQRKISRTISPRPDRTVSVGKRSTHSGSASPGGFMQQSQLLPGVDLNSFVDPSFSFSDATWARAERARTALELAYEHRRLLQYLPALPHCSECRPSTAKSTTDHTSSSIQPLGRVYNPLQYIRNRKVRVRERQTLDSEADGWKDLDSVRSWIDAVAAERRDHVSKIDDEYPLPPFSGREESTETSQDSPDVNGTNARSVQAKKSARPRNDWITSPWDFLGDHYWLAQEDHDELIEDHHRHKVYEKGVHRPDRVKPYSRRSVSISRAQKTPERSKTSGAIQEKDTLHDRGRARHQRYDSVQSLDEYSSSRERKSRWPRKLIRSYSSSSSDGSDDDLNLQDRGEDARMRREMRLFDRQFKEMMAEEQPDWNWDDVRDLDDGNTTDTKSPMVSAFNSRHASTGTPDEKAIATLRGKKQSQTPHKHHKTDSNGSLRQDLPSADSMNRGSPKSPGETMDVPRISIEGSPVVDRSDSPSGRRARPERSILSEMGKEREQIQDIDFAAESPKPSRKLRQSRVDLSNNIKSRFGGELLSPDVSDVSAKLQKRRTNTLKEEDRKHSESRLRGLLKGARLADIVSSPVNRVGDFIWRRDAIDQEEGPEVLSPVSNYTSATDTEDEDLKTGISRSTTGLSKQSSIRAPKYHIDNLPVFKSPFAQVADQTASENEGEDHISRQRSALRKSRSKRLDKLAPPSLDMRSISRSRSPTPERARSLDTTSDDSRRPSSDRRNAVVEGSPDRRGRRHPITGPSVPRSRSPFQDDVGFMNLKLLPSSGNPTESDLARVVALLKSTRIKANHIIHLATSVRESPHPIIQDLRRTSSTPIEPILRAQEPVFVGGLLVKRIDAETRAVQDAAGSVRDRIVPELHAQLHKLDEFITNNLTGMVRKATDDADDLGAQLATDCTMEVKRLNENIDLVLRRRRRRMRWVRRGGFMLLEWTLLALMWIAWGVVVVVRGVRGCVRWGGRAGRWLLWLD
ncbi:MAG: hypothetical protein MMC23_007942 [Stictis urceolatum]|nr:hypothetical protein [Stictis urceolata]